MKSTGNRILLVTLLIAGGVSVLLATVGCGIAGYFVLQRPTPAVAGQWQLVNGPLAGARVIFLFRADGTGMIQMPTSEVDFQYTLSDAKPPILEWRITHLDTQLHFPGKHGGKRAVQPHGQIQIKENDLVVVSAVTERFRVTLGDETLMLTNENGAAPFVLRRAR
jgi:hypothetical protein